VRCKGCEGDGALSQLSNARGTGRGYARVSTWRGRSNQEKARAWSVVGVIFYVLKARDRQARSLVSSAAEPASGTRRHTGQQFLRLSHSTMQT
jgi:hypothetical protein